MVAHGESLLADIFEGGIMCLWELIVNKLFSAYLQSAAGPLVNAGTRVIATTDYLVIGDR